MQGVTARNECGRKFKIAAGVVVVKAKRRKPTANGESGKKW